MRLPHVALWTITLLGAFQGTKVKQSQIEGIEVRFKDINGKIVSLGRTNSLTFESGAGINLIGFEAPDISIQVSANTAVLLSQRRYQTADPIRCMSTDGSGISYRCDPIPWYQSYGPDMPLIFRPDVVNLANATLNIANLGPRLLKKRTAAGLENLSAGDLIPGMPYWLISTDDAWVVLPLVWK